MSSSPNLGIALLAEAQSSKYVTVNNAIDALDGAITDVFTQAMADANQTPSTANALAHMVIQCTGALTADRNLVLPNAKKVYAINNQTTGSHNIVVKTSGSGSTVSIGAACKWVYCDGSNNFTQIGS
jgi:hypothetical protein